MGERQAITVDTHAGRVEGLVQDGIARFLGLPYAAPPTGERRLRSPGPAPHWTGVRDATTAAPASLQTLGGNQVWMNEPIECQSEDCLYLNIWTPDVTGRLPVLFWLHGGQTRNGHGAAPGIDGSALAKLGLVVVTINYRLGALGGLAHPMLEDTVTGYCGNWGLQDKLAALAWVAGTIAGFGGDPARITLAGQSSGGANALIIAQHGLAAGTYSRVIAQSAPLFRPPMFVDLPAAAAYTEAFAARVGSSVTGLRAMDGRELQKAEHAFAYSPELVASMGRPRTAPVRDGRLIREWPYDTPAVRVPMLAGWTRHEANFWFDLVDGDGCVISPLKAPREPEELDKRIAGLLKLHYAFESPPSAAAVARAYAGSDAPANAWRDFYTDLVFRAPILHAIGRQARARQPVWAYEFAQPVARAEGGSPHASDVPFVFGTWRHPHFACKIGGGPGVETISLAMMEAWTAFARGESPGWAPFDPASPMAMRFGPDRAEALPIERASALALFPAYAA